MKKETKETAQDLIINALATLQVELNEGKYGDVDPALQQALTNETNRVLKLFNIVSHPSLGGIAP